MMCPILAVSKYSLCFPLLHIFILAWIIIAPLLIVERLDRVIKLLKK
jgi:hypothetical protein